MANPEHQAKGAQAPFHLILAPADDDTALRVCRALKPHANAQFVTPEELFMAPHWSHDPLGDSRVVLASGLVLTDKTVLSVFNRVTNIAPMQFAAATRVDQIYASEEFFALIISWLTGFGARCVNLPHPGNVAGFGARSAAEDRLRLGADIGASSRARHLGLGHRLRGYPDSTTVPGPGAPAQVTPEADTARVLVAGDWHSAPLPPDIAKTLRAEMLHRKITLAEARFERAGDRLQIVALDPLPQTKDPAELDAIAAHLCAQARPERKIA